MSGAPTVVGGITEARGSYNKYAAPQAAGGAFALPLLEKAARDIALDSGDHPIVIADYGSSQGKNSLKPMRAAIAALRRRISAHRPICVVHIDVAENDFSTLFDVVNNDPDSYIRDDDDVYLSAAGRSFYRAVLPPGHVHLGWSSFAAVWLSRAPTIIPGHFWIGGATGEVHAAFERQAAEDWQAFLRLRARELRSGGRLVVTLPSPPEDRQPRIHTDMNYANDVLAEMVADGGITADERARMLLLSYPRRKSELLVPFSQAGRFEGLAVEQFEAYTVPDPDWPQYEHDHDGDKLAAKHAGFYRATFMPSLASALEPGRGAKGRQQFIDRLADGLKRRLAEDPAPLRIVAQVLLMSKLDGP